MSAFLGCDKCGETITRLEEGGWQIRGTDRKDYYGHYGMCPRDIALLWERIRHERWKAATESWELNTSLGDPELPVEPVPQSL